MVGWWGVGGSCGTVGGIDQIRSRDLRREGPQVMVLYERGDDASYEEERGDGAAGSVGCVVLCCCIEEAEQRYREVWAQSREWLP